MKKIILIICCSLFLIGLFAQEQDNLIRKNEFGINAGFCTGTGLSYRYWPGKLGVQLTLLPIKTNDFTWVSTGLTALINFYDSKYFRFFGYIGNHYIIHNYERTDSYNYLTGQWEYGRSENSSYNFGFGPGFAFGTRVRFNLMVGYGFYDVLDEFNMLPTGELGLYFRF